MRRSIAATLALTVAATLAVSCQVGSAAVADPVNPATAWLQRTYGLTQADAERRLASERASGHAAGSLLQALGSDAAGAWLKPETGELVIDVVDRAALPAVRAAHARPRLVRHSASHLRGLKRRLDAQAERTGAGRAVSWRIDLPSNALIIDVGASEAARAEAAGAEPATAATDATDAFLRFARTLGEAVRIRAVTGATTTYRDLLGGQDLETDDHRVCSLGFNATDKVGRPVLLTAGHCGRYTSEFSQHGRVVGHVRAARFPGDDFAVVALDNVAQWSARPWVERYLLRPRAVRGHSAAVVGSTVCKSGGTTKWTCGRIVAQDVTVYYDDGSAVNGLTQASTCSGNGDSGGPLLAGGYAQGLLSGGQSIDGRCLERYGMENVSYFQPVGEALSRYGLRLLTTR
jgi:alpha-lytic protease prodomain-containing protein/trypsin